MQFRYISILLMGVLFGACRKCDHPGEKEYLFLSYRQTACADPWENAATDSLTLVNVRKFLDASGLYVANLSITNDGTQQTCDACICKTGKTIVVSTLNSQTLKEKYRQIGFQ